MGFKNVKNRLVYLTRLINKDLYYLSHKQPTEGHFILSSMLSEVKIVTGAPLFFFFNRSTSYRN